MLAANGNFCILLYTSVYFCIRLYTSVYVCILLYTSVYFCILLYTSVYFCILLYTSVYFCILLYTSGYFLILFYVNFAFESKKRLRKDLHIFIYSVLQLSIYIILNCDPLVNERLFAILLSPSFFPLPLFGWGKNLWSLDRRSKVISGKHESLNLILWSQRFAIVKACCDIQFQLFTACDFNFE